jgi:hypothetical protein
MLVFEEAFDGALAGAERLVVVVDVAGEQVGALGVGARDDHVGTSGDVGGEARGDQLLTASWVGTSTLPPMWPHFLAEASWSSKCTPAAPASIIAFISSKAFSTPPKPASASATIGCSQSMSSPSAWWIWSARSSVLLMRAPPRHRVDRIQRLVRIHLAGGVGVGRDLPAGEIDRLEAGLDLLHRLVAGQRAERVDEGLGVQVAPELLGAERRACARRARCRAGAPRLRRCSRA